MASGSHVRRLLALTLATLAAVMLGGSFFTLWRLRSEAITSGYESAAMHARGYEEFLTQTLRVTELAAATTVTAELDAGPARMSSVFQATVRNAPFLRSMSLLDRQGRVVASSNPANVGLQVPTGDFLPLVPPTREVLRIGRPWIGRDFANGEPAAPGTTVPADSLSFLPVMRQVLAHGEVHLLVMALNPDYFVDHFLQTIDTDDGAVRILRYDGALLFDTVGTQMQADELAGLMAQMRLAETDSGRFERTSDGQAMLAAYRSSRLYPIVVLTELKRAEVLDAWRHEARTLLMVILPAVTVVLALGFAYYLRRRQFDQVRELAEREQAIHARVFQVSPDAIIITDEKARIIAVNDAFTRITGYTLAEVVGRNPRLITANADDFGFYEEMWKSLLTADTWAGELMNKRKNGELYPARLTVSVARDGRGQIRHVICDMADITAQREVDEQLRLAASVFTHAREAILITSADGEIIDINDAFTRITGYTREEAIGRRPNMLSSGRHDKAFYEQMWRELHDKGYWYGEIWNRRKNGEVYPELLTIGAVREPREGVRHYVALFSDITKVKEHEEELEHIAHYDALTNLPNRILLADRLRQAIAQSRRRGTRLAVAFIDLDGFKQVNDVHGHDAGDALLVELAQRMRGALREGDTLARLGGDEFVAVLFDLPDANASLPLLGRLLAATAQPVMFDGRKLQVSGSVGVTFYPQAEDVDADTLLRQADQAMYQAKVLGKNRCHIFDATEDRNMRNHHESIERLRRALEAGEFVLHYQPKVNLRSGRVVGAEALIRWQHPERGLLAPAQFLPDIEEHALAVAVGEWVLTQALRQSVAWRQAGLALPVSVNIGARQLQQDDFVERLRALLEAQPEAVASDLELEILETSALEDLARVSRLIEACQRLGISLALDDFGTGYSSLTYLKRLPVETLKIDQSFVRGMLDDPDDLAILEGVIGLAASFRRGVIAEGVETHEHAELLMRLGCEYAQGHGIARPMPADEMLPWVRTWRPPAHWRQTLPFERRDLPLLFASVEHRAWIKSVEDLLSGQQDRVPSLSPHDCRFGLWLETDGRRRFGLQSELGRIDSLHQRIHKLAHEMVELQAAGRTGEARAHIDELRALRDGLLECMRILIRKAGRTSAVQAPILVE